MVLLDTSFIIAYYNEEDVHHMQAVSLMNDITSGKYGGILISDYIFDEVISVMVRKVRDIKKVLAVMDDLLYFTSMQFIEKSIFNRAYDVFKSQKETLLSFTDCTIIAHSQGSSHKEIATFDKDFEKVKGIKVLN